MLTELACFNQDCTYNDILETIFTSAQQEMHCVSLPSGLMSRVDGFLGDQQFAAAIDFPYGLSTPQVRVHEIILAIRQGASFIDLVLNNGHIKEESWRKIKEDLKSCLAVCKQHNVELRPIVEYRLFSPKTVLLLCELLSKMHVSFLINCTGSFVDDLDDNTIMCHDIQTKTDLLVIACSKLIDKKYFNLFSSMEIHGVRFTSPKMAENVLRSGV